MTQEEEIVDRVLFRMEGVRRITMDCYLIEYYDHKDDKQTRTGYIGVIRGGYQHWLDSIDGIYDDVHYVVQNMEELMALEIGKSFTCDSEWDILASIDICVDHTNIFTYKYEDIYDDTN